MIQAVPTKHNQQNLQGEISHLQENLQLRDQLVEQLSQELFRLIKDTNTTKYQADPEPNHQGEIAQLRENLRETEKQVEFYQEQISVRDEEIYQLRQCVQELTDRSRMLEMVVQELPHIYRQKFSERLVPIRDKVVKLKQENQRLHSETQSLSYRLAVKNRRNANKIEIPDLIGGQGNNPIPSFGSA